jgi:dTDP-4-amino-4,6-dideoxygalactose transaminase
MTPIPLVDLGAQHRQIADEVAEGLDRVIGETAFILGEEVREFEREYADFLDAPYCLGVASGTDALELALRALGIGPGDEVILPANTFIATALAVARAGATPVLVDCDPDHHLIDPEEVAGRLGPRTRAVMAVHLYGQMAPMEALGEVVDGTEVRLLEDAAQAQGAKRHGRSAGTIAVAAGTSFYPGKNLGAYGDAGAVTTTVEDVARRVAALRNYGSEVKYHHPETGFNSRLDTLQAVVLRAKLRLLPQWNDARREAAGRYDRLLGELEVVTLPETLSGNEHVFHLYVVRVPERDQVLRRLNAAGVGAGIHYPVPVHLQGAFGHLGHEPGDFPVTEAAADEVLSLPLFPEIAPEQQEQVADELRRALA